MTLVATSAKSSGSSAAAGAWQLVTSQTLGVAGNFDFNNIAQTFTDLLVNVVARSSAVANQSVCSVILNADSTAAHYNYQNSTGSAVTFGTAFLQNAGGNGVFCLFPADSATANAFGNAEIYLPSYSSAAFLKTVRIHDSPFYSNVSGSLTTDITDGYWTSAAAITRVQIQVNAAGTFKAGSVAYLYAR